MSSELVIDVKADEIVIALLREKKLIELTKEKTSMQFAVGDIYLGKVKKIMPGLNAAFVNVGYEKDAFLHYLDLSPQFHSLDSYIKQCIARKGRPVSKLKLETGNSQKWENCRYSDSRTMGGRSGGQRTDFYQRTPLDFRTEYCRTESGIDAFCR